MNSERKFKLGTLVKLKGGTTKMTVVQYTEPVEEIPILIASWFEGKIVRSAKIPEKSLELFYHFDKDQLILARKKRTSKGQAF